MQKFLPELVFHQDEPIADPVCVPLYYVSKLARDTGTIVVQVGEGSDEIFAGYDWFRTYLQHLKIDSGVMLNARPHLHGALPRRWPAAGTEGLEEADGSRVGPASGRK